MELRKMKKELNKIREGDLENLRHLLKALVYVSQE
jgi:hypothetical protein